MATKIEVKPQEETSVEVKQEVAEENQTIVHCICGQDAAYRIWPSAFLIEHNSSKRAKLITAYNISFYPDWTLKNKGEKFTLIFEGLSRNCVIFDLKEIIPQAGGFEANNIVRNNSDVYSVEIE